MISSLQRLQRTFQVALLSFASTGCLLADCWHHLAEGAAVEASCRSFIILLLIFLVHAEKMMVCFVLQVCGTSHDVSSSVSSDWFECTNVASDWFECTDVSSDWS